MLRLNRPRVFFIPKQKEGNSQTENFSEIRFVFEKSAKELRAIKGVICYETLLHLYSLYKQATQGDVSIAPPQNSNNFYALAKYQAWKGQKGKSTQKAMEEYIYFVHRFKTTYTQC